MKERFLLSILTFLLIQNVPILAQYPFYLHESTQPDPVAIHVDSLYTRALESFSSGEYRKAEELIEQTIASAASKNLYGSLHKAYLLKADYLLQKTDFVQGLNIAYKSLQQAQHLPGSGPRIQSEKIIAKFDSTFFAQHTESNAQNWYRELKNTLENNYKQIENIRDENEQNIQTTILISFSILLLMIVFLIIIMREKEKNRLAYEQIKLLNDRQNLYFSIIAHDIGGRLHSARNILQTIHPQQINTNDYTSIRSLELLNKLFLKVDTSFENLLEMAIPSGINITPALEKLDLTTMLERFHYMADEARQKGVTLRIASSPPIWAMADKQMILSVMDNLIRNAMRHTHTGHISIALHKENGEAILKVTDTGEGMEEERLQQIFSIDEPRNQNSSGKTGHGFGLFISRKIIGAHGGKMGVSSSPSNGSTFWFTLPLANEYGTDHGK